MKRKNFYTIFILCVLVIAFFVVFARLGPASDRKPGTQANINGAPDDLMAENDEPKEEVPDNSELYPDALLPDLWVQKLSSAYIATNGNGVRTLRFPGTFANTGDGPLEIEGSPDEANNAIFATQIIYKKNGSKDGQFAGSFILHPTHRHWHFEDFVSFAILEAKNDSTPGRELVSTGKVTYCIHDYGPLPDDYLGKPTGVVYPWCTASFGTQGISVGWVDTYEANVPGQELNITDLPNGTYAFRAIADPENRLREKDESNNTTFTFIEIAGNDVRILDELGN